MAVETVQFPESGVFSHVDPVRRWPDYEKNGRKVKAGSACLLHYVRPVVDRQTGEVQKVMRSVEVNGDAYHVLSRLPVGAELVVDLEMSTWGQNGSGGSRIVALGVKPAAAPAKAAA